MHIYHPRCIIFFSQYFSFPLSVSFHHCSILIHPSIYHPRCIMFLSQHFSFPLSVSFHHCSILIHPSTTHATIQFSPVSIISPLLHTHPSIYHPHRKIFSSQHFSFPLSLQFHHYSILIHPSTTHTV